MKLLSAPSSALRKGDQTPRESRLEERYILENKKIDGLERIEYSSNFHLRRISPIVPSSISWSTADLGVERPPLLAGADAGVLLELALRREASEGLTMVNKNKLKFESKITR